MNVFFLRKYSIKIINKRLNLKRSAAYLSIIFAIRQVAFLIFPAPVRIRHDGHIRTCRIRNNSRISSSSGRCR